MALLENRMKVDLEGAKIYLHCNICKKRPSDYVLKLKGYGKNGKSFHIKFIDICHDCALDFFFGITTMIKNKRKKYA